METRTKLAPRAGLSNGNGKEREIRIKGDLILTKAVTRFPHGVNRVVVEGSVKGNGAKNLLAVWGDLEVKGDINCHNLRVGGSVEAAGVTSVTVLNVHTFAGPKVTAKIVRAWNVDATEAELKSGSVGFVTSERLRYGPGLKFYRMVRNVSRYNGQDGAARGDDVILPRR
jgi:cytoskeletal protein CcmA (bactofilin family)